MGRELCHWNESMNDHEELKRDGNSAKNRQNHLPVFLAAVLLLLLGAAAGFLLGRHFGEKEPEIAVTSFPEESETVSAEEIISEEEMPEELSESAEELADILAGIIDAGIPNAAAFVTGHAGGGHIVCIDPGHQDHGMSDTEPNGPGASEMKAKLTSGTQGVATGITEYQINLEIGLILRDILLERGYQVVMTRESNDVEISNVERALIAEEAGAEAFVRLHCNGSDNRGVSGALAYQPSYGNRYLTPEVIEGSQRLALCVLEEQVKSTGQKSQGIIAGDDMTGINWAKMPVTIIEMGFMSNPDEDRFLADAVGQRRIAEGIANGVDRFFSE